MIAEAPAWDDAGDLRAASEPEFIVDVSGFEGPLDLLLHLARRQKVDLARISVSALAEQYLHFVREAQALRLELAADYLVMAAWLAFLKSRLLLPAKPAAEEASGEEMAAALRFRLQRLEAMRGAAARLFEGPQLRRDVFPRGNPQQIAVERRPAFSATLHDLLKAYAARRQRLASRAMRIAERSVLSLGEARETLERLLGSAADWTALERFMSAFPSASFEQASLRASIFAASLELVREGRMELRQDAPFARLYLRAAGSEPAPPVDR